MSPFDPDALPVPDLGLSCPRCGYPLAGLTEHRCPECGRPFTLSEFIPKGDFPPLIAGGREVRATPEVVALLRRYQVAFVPLLNSMEGAFGGVRLSGETPPPPIAVPREQYLETVDLIRRQTLGEPMPPPPAPPASSAEWTCPACGEANPANFEVCWHCGGPREA